MEEHKQPPYMMVWLALFVLTAVEVGIALMSGLPRTLLLWILVGLAVWKAVLVAMYYMHLKFERTRMVILAAVPLPLAFLLVLIVLAEYAR